MRECWLKGDVTWELIFPAVPIFHLTGEKASYGGVLQSFVGHLAQLYNLWASPGHPVLCLRQHLVELFVACALGPSRALLVQELFALYLTIYYDVMELVKYVTGGGWVPPKFTRCFRQLPYKFVGNSHEFIRQTGIPAHP